MPCGEVGAPSMLFPLHSQRQQLLYNTIASHSDGMLTEASGGQLFIFRNITFMGLHAFLTRHILSF